MCDIPKQRCCDDELSEEEAGAAGGMFISTRAANCDRAGATSLVFGSAPAVRAAEALCVRILRGRPFLGWLAFVAARLGAVGYRIGVVSMAGEEHRRNAVT
jgi:hypothetical protein